MEWHDVSKNKKSDLEKTKNKRQETLGWRMAEREKNIQFLRDHTVALVEPQFVCFLKSSLIAH